MEYRLEYVLESDRQQSKLSCRPTHLSSSPLYIYYYTSSLVVYYLARQSSLSHRYSVSSSANHSRHSKREVEQTRRCTCPATKTMSGNHSSLLQTAIQNLQISQQAKDRDRPTRTSSDFGSPQSEHLELSASEDEGDEIVNVGQGTRPPTRPGSPGPRKLGLRDVSRLSSGESSSTDPVSLHCEKLEFGVPTDILSFSWSSSQRSWPCGYSCNSISSLWHGVNECAKGGKSQVH